MTVEEIREKGVNALIKFLGPVGAVKFILQFEKGKGDYTSQRDKKMKNLSLDHIVKSLRKP